jgi:hypothetical protein
MGIFSRMAFASQARIFRESSCGSIFSGAVDFMLVASAGAEAQSKDRANRIASLCRMAASCWAMIARLVRPMQELTRSINDGARMSAATSGNTRPGFRYRSSGYTANALST